MTAVHFMLRAAAVLRRGLLAVFLLGVVCWPAQAAAQADAAGEDNAQRTRSDLDEVQRRIRELEQAIKAQREALSAAEKQRAETERAVSASRRKLRDLNREVAAAQQQLTEQEAEQAAVTERIQARQNELAAWLKQQYLHGASNVAPFLATRDPNQLARDLHYLEYLGRARLELIEQLRTDLQQAEALAEQIKQRHASLKQLAAAQEQESAVLQQRLAERAKQVAGIKAELGQQQQEVAGLREDEEQLGKVLELLARRQAEREAARQAERARREAEEAARQAAQEKARLAQLNEAGHVEAGAPRPRTDNRSPETRPDASRTAAPTPTGMSFAQLRGRMRLPVQGQVASRFGAPRAEGGTRWRGVFIRAQSGSSVHAVAPGEVVYSDWLRGYGNLIIIDHGQDYMTVYGHNDALYETVGNRVSADTPIASVGASGSMVESGLYFEVRHKGQPVDPLNWVRAQ